jgi:hypothetical protein
MLKLLHHHPLQHQVFLPDCADGCNLTKRRKPHSCGVRTMMTITIQRQLHQIQIRRNQMMTTINRNKIHHNKLNKEMDR